MLPCRININKMNEKRRLTGEVVHLFGGLAFCRVYKRETWTGIAHMLNVGIHPRPVRIAQSNTVKCPVSIEMSANCIGMKCHKEDVAKFCWNKVEAVK
jgi:hypothetical protein